MSDPSALALESSSRVGVIGGGPAVSFFSYFPLDMAQGVGMEVQVDMYPRRVHDDPVLAFRILQRTSQRIRELHDKLVRMKAGR